MLNYVISNLVDLKWDLRSQVTKYLLYIYFVFFEIWTATWIITFGKLKRYHLTAKHDQSFVTTFYQTEINIKRGRGYGGKLCWPSYTPLYLKLAENKDKLGQQVIFIDTVYCWIVETLFVIQWCNLGHLSQLLLLEN